LLLLAAHATGLAATGAPNAVHLAPGLAVTAVIHDSVDYEFIAVTKSASADGTGVAYHWTRPDASAPGGKRETSAMAVTSTADLDTARRLILVHITGDAETFPGATRGRVSRAVYQELKDKGAAAIVVGGVKASGANPLSMMFSGRKYFRGTMQRV
jgi:hypothetical protein